MASKARKRGYINFQTPTGRTILSREEYLYWMNHLPKVLKIGTEFEQNLPSAQGALGDNDDRDCTNLNTGCSTQGCVHTEQCILDPHPTLCLTRASGTYLEDAFACPAQNANDAAACKTCPAWQLDCRKNACAMFLPFCTVCPSFTRSSMGPEKADVRRDAAQIRQDMTELLMPTEFVGEVGKKGVLKVTKDDSLQSDGGAEIITVGRRFQWASFYRMCKDVIDPLLERGAYVNERAGQHFHVLAGYLPKDRDMRAVSELEKPLPEIVMANLHQLHRRYELAMFWIMSAGTSRESLTRWARFRQTIFPFSALRSRMSRVVQDLAETIICKGGSPKDGKYGSVAYYFSKFEKEGDVSIFHFENRIADGAQSPAVVTAWAAMCYAMVLKAVRCSQYGILEVGTRDYVEMVKQLQPKLIDGGNREWNGSRKADTSGLTRDDFAFLIGSAEELVNFLKPELAGLGPAFDILAALARRPCSLRLSDGEGWAQIEADLMRGAPIYEPGELGTRIQELIDLSVITECGSIEEWIQEVSGNTGAPAEEVASVIQGMIEHHLCRWSNPLGSVIGV